jgi:ferredoxin
MRVRVDENLCAGAGECEATCPQVFKVVDGVSRVQVDPVPAGAEASCRKAAKACPMGAISIQE